MMHHLNLNPLSSIEIKDLSLEERNEAIELIDDMIDNCDYLKPSEIDLLQRLVNNYRKLEAHKDSTVGLYATDKQEQAKGEFYFQITY